VPLGMFRLQTDQKGAPHGVPCRTPAVGDGLRSSAGSRLWASVGGHLAGEAPRALGMRRMPAPGPRESLTDRAAILRPCPGRSGMCGRRRVDGPSPTQAGACGGGPSRGRALRDGGAWSRGSMAGGCHGERSGWELAGRSGSTAVAHYAGRHRGPHRADARERRSVGVVQRPAAVAVAGAGPLSAPGDRRERRPSRSGGLGTVRGGLLGGGPTCSARVIRRTRCSRSGQRHSMSERRRPTGRNGITGNRNGGRQAGNMPLRTPSGRSSSSPATRDLLCGWCVGQDPGGRGS
jgi:hypothetical protein